MRALVRNPHNASHLAAAGVELIPGALDDAPALSRLVAGCAAVVHAAGAVRGNSQQDFDRVNVAGTQAVLAAVAAAAPTARLLLVSSLAAREPQLSWYARSKHAAEQLLPSRADLDWLILRPPVVYGPGDREMLPVFRAMARGIATVPGSIEARTSLIHVSDLVAAMHACLDSDRVRHLTLSLDDGRPGGYSWADMAAAAEQVLSRRVRLWQVPRRLLDGLAAANSALARVSGRAPMLTPPKLRELRHPDWVVDNREITAATGWQPRIGLVQGLQSLDL